MARIAGANLPREKRVEVALTYIFGLGISTSRKLLTKLEISPNTRVKDLTDQEVNQLRQIIENNYRVEGDLRRDIFTHIKRLKEINCYRGTRHTKHLPTRGQRTKTNTRTVRGNVRKTMGSGKKASAQKT